MRIALVAGSVAAAVVAALAAEGAGLAIEPELAVLLRGMAVIKGLLAVAAVVLVGWRLGQPIASRLAGAYIACACVLVAGTVLIWQLAFIVTAAGLFHTAGLVALVIAMREDRSSSIRSPRHRFDERVAQPLTAKRDPSSSKRQARGIASASH